MLEQFARLFLAFSHDTIILPVSIIGYIWLDKKIFFHAICIILVSMLFNFSLKVTFQVPLVAALGKEGFAFPSGHMQASLAFYGWIFVNTYRFLVRILLTVLLIGIGISLIYLGYHNYLDVLGALFFGIVLMCIYYVWVFVSSRNGVLLEPILYTIITSTLLMFYCKFIYKLEEHLWMAYYAIIGITFAEYYFKNQLTLPNRKSKVVATVFCVVMLTIAHITVHKIVRCIALPSYIVQLQWLSIGFSIPFSCYFSNRYKRLSS